LSWITAPYYFLSYLLAGVSLLADFYSITKYSKFDK